MCIGKNVDHVLKKFNMFLKYVNKAFENFKKFNMYRKNIDHVLKNINLVFEKC